MSGLVYSTVKYHQMPAIKTPAREISPTLAKLVLLIIAEQSNDHGEMVRHSQREIAKVTQLSLSTVSYIIGALKNTGYLSVTTLPGKHGIYRLNLTKLKASSVAPSATPMQSSVAPSATPMQSSVAPSATVLASSVAPGATHEEEEEDTRIKNLLIKWGISLTEADDFLIADCKTKYGDDAVISALHLCIAHRGRSIAYLLKVLNDKALPLEEGLPPAVYTLTPPPPPDPVTQIWERARDVLRMNMSRAQYASVVAGAKLQQNGSPDSFLIVPADERQAIWVPRHLTQIQRAISQVVDRDVTVAIGG